MSRTFKDNPPKYRFQDYGKFGLVLQGSRFIQLKTDKTKKRRTLDNDYRWYRQNPSWWNKIYFYKPLRSKIRYLENKIKKTPIKELDLIYFPEFGNKPHIYYW